MRVEMQSFPGLSYRVTTQDADVAGSAFAMAGVLAAADLDPWHAEYRNLWSPGGRQSIYLWSYPRASDLSGPPVVSDVDLAAIWRSIDRPDPFPGGRRLLILPHTLAPAEIQSAVELLLAPLRQRLAGGGGDWRGVESWLTASACLLTAKRASPYPWDWPVSISVPRSTIGSFDPFGPAYRGLARLGTPALIGRRSDMGLRFDHGHGFRSFGTNVGIGFQIASSLEGGAEAVSRRLGEIVMQDQGSRRPETLLQLSTEEVSAFLTSFIYELSHDAPPDIAVYGAASAAILPETPMPIFVAPGVNFLEQMDAARISSRIWDLTGRIDRLIDTTPAVGSIEIDDDSLGVARGIYSLRELRDGLVESALKGRVRFDHESDTGSVLPQVSGQIAVLEGAFGLERLRRARSGWGDLLNQNFGPVSGGVDIGPDIGPVPFPDLSPVPAPQPEPAAPEPPPGTVPLEQDRVFDAIFLDGHAENESSARELAAVPDDQPLKPHADYTLEIAIRAEPKGIGAGQSAFAVITPPRRDGETVKVYARVWCSRSDILKFDDGFLPMDWPFDSDSGSAYFTCTTERPADETARIWVEIRLYSEHLHLLELVEIRDIVVSDYEYAGCVRQKVWPSSRPSALSPLAQDKPVELSLHVRAQPGGFEMEAIFLRGDRRLEPIPFDRTIPSGDVADLLRSVRDHWTDLVVGKLSSKLSLTKAGYGDVMTTMWLLGLRAWKILFGDRTGPNAGASEAVGALIASLQLPPNSLIQITSDKDSVHLVFPWAIVRPPADLGAPVDPQAFWGLRYIIEQTRKRGKAEMLLAGDPPSMVSVLDKGFSGQVEHRKTLASSFAAANQNNIAYVSTSRELLARLADDPPAQLYYFFCHGFSPGGEMGLARELIHSLQKKLQDIGNQDVWDTFLTRMAAVRHEAKLFFGTHELTETEISQARFFNGDRSPIVFLNMCQSADLLPARERGFVHQFIGRSASAVIGTECPMTAIFADAFAGRVLSSLAKGVPVGMAVLEARRHFHDERNPLGFAYTVYGRTDARLGGGDGVGV